LGSVRYFDALSLREPVPTSLENALVILTRFLHANRFPLLKNAAGHLFMQMAFFAVGPSIHRRKSLLANLSSRFDG
jgi:hypothetical protein